MRRGAFSVLAATITGRPRTVLSISLVCLVLAGLAGGGVGDRLSAGGFFDESSESRRADVVLEEAYGAGPTNAALLVDPVEGFVSGHAEHIAAIHRAMDADPLIENVRSPADPETDRLVEWPTGLHPLIGGRGKTALIVFTIVGDEDEVIERVDSVETSYAGVRGGVEHTLTGPAPVARQTRDVAEEDLTRSELLTAPVTLVALLVVFGGLVAALLPLAVAIWAIIGTFVVLTVATGFTDVSVFARTLTSALGVGLGIDYSLFVVSRFREERASGIADTDAIDRTLRTAGRTVLFSAATVAASLSALFLFPISYLRSFALSGVAVVALAAFASVVVLPSGLLLLGDRIDSWSPRRRPTTSDGSSFWQRQAARVLRRPVPYALGVTLLLLALGLPFAGIEVSRIDDRVLPTDASTRVAAESIRTDYQATSLSTVDIVVLDFGVDDPDPNRCETIEASQRCLALDGYARALFDVEGVGSVMTERGVYMANLYAVDVPLDVVEGGVAAAGSSAVDIRRVPSITDSLAAPGVTRLSLSLDVEPISAEGEAVVDRVRAISSGFDEVLVSGDSARLRDLRAVLSDRVPLAIGWVAVSTIVVLVLMLGAPLLALKALALNVLSLTATFGAMVWIFQDGNLASLLDFSATGSIDMFTPILMFCIAFGLSMDYEVFLLSRIKEEYDLCGDNERAVEIGLGRTGPIVTAAAVLLALVFAAIGTSSVSVVKMLGVGMVLAVLSDAFLIRATLVPAWMKLAGGVNWWAPGWLRRAHLRWGLWESEPVRIGD